MRLLLAGWLSLLALAGCGGGERGKGIPFFKKGQQLVLRKEFEDARAAFEECLRRQPGYGPAHLALGMLSEEPFADLWGAAWHYREFLRLSPEHAERPVVERWLGRIERRLLTELAEQHPEVLDDGEAEKVRAERDDLLDRLRRAQILYERTRAEKETIERQLAALDEQRLAAERERTQEELARGTPVVVSARGEDSAPPAPPAKAAEPVPEPVKPVRMHEIVGGDTLAAISRQYYGSVRYWPRLQVYNRDLLRGGTVLILGRSLRIPPLEELKKITVPSSDRAK